MGVLEIHPEEARAIADSMANHSADFTTNVKKLYETAYALNTAYDSAETVKLINEIEQYHSQMNQMGKDIAAYGNYFNGLANAAIQNQNENISKSIIN